MAWIAGAEAPAYVPTDPWTHGPMALPTHRPTDLLDEQHLAIRRQRPHLVRDVQLEGVARVAQFLHQRDDLVAEVLRVLRRTVAVVLERLGQLRRRALQRVD